MTELQNELHELIVQDQKKIFDPLAQTALQTQKKDNLSVFVNNVKIYCSILIEKSSDQNQVSKLKYLLQNQIADVWFQEPLKDFRLLIDKVNNNIQGYPLFKNLTIFQEICRQIIKMKGEAQNEEAYEHAQKIIEGFFQQLEQMIGEKQKTIEKLNKYDVYGTGDEGESRSQRKKNGQNVKDHFEKQLINTKIDFQPSVFNWAEPLLHRVYISQASKAYNEVVPFRIKTIIPHSTQSPNINIRNYFSESIDQNKAIIPYLIPGTNRVGYYLMNDICKLLSMDRQYYLERQLKNEWTFSHFTRSAITPEGKIFAINCRTTKEKIDPCMYQITQTKASNRGPLPSPKRQSSFIYLNGYLYVMGGHGQGQKCSKKNYRYSIKDKKWSSLSESNVALKKPTLCTLNNRYILKIGGLNEFDYINKVIEIYDPLSNKWSLVRATAKNVMEEIQILQDSLAVQINDDQIYIFGGKNNNKYSVDKGFILQITEIRERRKGAAKVNGQLWNVNVGKRNLLTFFGAYSPCNVVVHFNCIYFLRVKYVQALSI